MQLIGAAGRGVAVYAKQGCVEAVAGWELPILARLGLSGPWGVNPLGRMGLFLSAGTVRPTVLELPSEMSGRGSNPRLVSFYKEIKHTDGWSILYLKSRKKILRVGAGGQQTRSNPGSEGANNAVSGHQQRAGWWGNWLRCAGASLAQREQQTAAPPGHGEAADSRDPGGGLQGGPG